LLGGGYIHEVVVGINNGVLSDMGVLESFMALLLESRKTTMGDSAYCISEGNSSPVYLLDYVCV
jgi:hypothetical protein